MRVSDIKTRKDICKFSHKRNYCFGNLKLAKCSFKDMINSDLIDSKDKKILRKLIIVIDFILNRWDKHYTTKLLKSNEDLKCN